MNWLERLDARISRCDGCDDWRWDGRCGRCDAEVVEVPAERWAKSA